MKKGLVIVLLVAIFAINLISAEAVQNSLHVNIQTTNSTGVINGTFAFGFNISRADDCATAANIIYADAATLTTDSRGIISHYLDNVNLNFTEQYWLCYYRDNSLINKSKIARSPYAFSAKNATTSGIRADADLVLGSYGLTTNGGWTNNGVSIVGGDIYAQTLFVYNITSLNINNLNVNGSLFPNLDNDLDIGSSSFRWKNLFLSGQVYSDGVSSNYFIGSLGIGGTTTPDAQLDVQGAIAQQGAGGISGYLTDGGVMSYNINKASSNAYLSLYDASANEDVKLDSNGNSWIQGGALGIGTNNPYHNLVVFADGTAPILSVDRAGVATIHMGLASDGTGVIGINGVLNAPQNITFRTGVTYNNDITATGTEVMRITGDGKLGIGTTSPNTNLEISHSGSKNESLRIGDSTHVGNDTGIYLRTTGSAKISVGSNAKLHLGGELNNEGLVVIDEATGNVGIGTTTPRSTLDVAGNLSLFNQGISGIVIGNYTSLTSFLDGEEGVQMWYDTSDQSFNMKNVRVGDSYKPFVFIGNNFTFQAGAITPVTSLFVNSSDTISRGSLTVGNGTTSHAWNHFGNGVKEVAAVNDANDVYVSGTLEVDGGAYLEGGDTVDPGIYWTASGADIAEDLATEQARKNSICGHNVSCYKEVTGDNIDYGHLVCINPAIEQTIMKCSSVNSKLVVGFVSDTYVLNVGGTTKGYPIALAGLVLAYVTNENGNINPGDLLVSSSKSGYAMKNDNPAVGTIVGKAYDFCDKEECRIAVFVVLG